MVNFPLCRILQGLRVLALLSALAAPAFAENDLVARHEFQAFHHADREVRFEGQMALAMDIARDPKANHAEIEKLLVMLGPGNPDALRYEVSKVFYWMLMHIHDTRAAEPIVQYLEALGLEEGRKGNILLSQGFLSAAMEGKKPEVPPGYDELSAEQESSLIEELNCRARLRAVSGS